MAGSFTLPIIKDESGSLTSVFLLTERAAAGDYTGKPGGDTGRWVLGEFMESIWYSNSDHELTQNSWEP